MFYLPDDWMVDKRNQEAVHKILNAMNGDIIADGGESFKKGLSQLKEIGETIILEKIASGAITFGA